MSEGHVLLVIEPDLEGVDAGEKTGGVYVFKAVFQPRHVFFAEHMAVIESAEALNVFPVVFGGDIHHAKDFAQPSSVARIAELVEKNSGLKIIDKLEFKSLR